MRVTHKEAERDTRRTGAGWMRVIALSVLAIGVLLIPQQRAVAAAPGCGQAPVEALLGAPAPPGPSAHYIIPNGNVAPFYQWQSNTGYCGEVSLMQAALANGEWLSQYNTRLVCGIFFGPESNGYGSSLEQAGSPLRKQANYNAELLLQAPGALTGPYDYGVPSRCAANARLNFTAYPTDTGVNTANTGTAGYEDFMSWIKAQVILGRQVALGVLINGSDDDQYDHIVSVIKIGTQHSPTDATYYPDDVIYFDDHGNYTVSRGSNGQWAFAPNPSIPLGAGSDPTGCTPYIFAYTFASLGRTRSGANTAGASAYSVVIPNANRKSSTVTGNAGAKGDASLQVPGVHNFGFAISGPLDAAGVTVPVVLDILATQTSVQGAWTPNPYDANSSPAAGYQYENPYIGGPASCDNSPFCVSNTKPPAMMMTLAATVRGLSPGVAYNLYEYDLPTLTGANTGTQAALEVPTKDFNANRAKASRVISFTATGSTYTTPEFTRSSDEVVVFRAVPVSAP